MKLLVAEDDAAVASNLVRGLRAQGFVIELATSGTQAREAIVRFAPDLVVLDLMLPELSGLALLEELSGKPHPPVIVLTARTDLNERLRCFELGASDYVPKPFFLEELVARINVRLVRRPGAPVASSASPTWSSISIDAASRSGVKRWRSPGMSWTCWLISHSGRTAP